MERLGWLENFDRVADGTIGRGRAGWHFSDSEAYKLLEAIAWAGTTNRDLDAMWQDLVARVASAQDDDGYLNTCFGHDGQPARYSDLSEGHELYCMGHLLQAAVARLRTRGADLLVDVARRAADHICREFGKDGNQGICGHPEIEVALVELGRALDEPRYIEQARLFIERRGRGTLTMKPLLSAAYFQDDVPVRDADVWRGHAVRALYLAAGAVDVATETGDGELLGAVERQWKRSVSRRTYLTGGMGSRHQDEGFGDDWELPADRAYCETCAGVASVMVSWRLLLATGDVKYADLIERTLYNVVATSPRDDGRAFFYANPLQQREPGNDVRPDTVNPRAEGGVRAPWFDVSCCPTNVARTLASWQSYAAFVDDSGEVPTIVLTQYAASAARIRLPGGAVVELDIDTTYPEDGTVHVAVRNATSEEFALRLRVPHWASGATVGRGDGDRAASPGWTEIDGPFNTGDEITLNLPLDPRLTWPDPRIDAVRGTVAVERGPLVMCLESVDLPTDVDIRTVRLDVHTPIVARGDVLAAGGMIAGLVAQDDRRPPFEGVRPSERGESAPLTLVPYHRWAQRGSSTMRVFLPIAVDGEHREART